MTERENLPTKIASQDVIVSTAQCGSLVARGLAAIQTGGKQTLLSTVATDAEKLFGLGMRYRYGENRTPCDDNKAREYFLAAAQLNHAEAQYELSLLLFEDGDKAAAEPWLKRAALLGFGPSQYQYATNFELPEDEYATLIESAFAWYEERARAGDAKRQFEFAEMHLSGEVNASNSEEGLRWLKLAAAQDYARACRELGKIYLWDRVTEYTTRQGIYWLSRAADLGDVGACRELGDLYLLGHNGGFYAAKQGRPHVRRIKSDTKKATAWYERGIAMGGGNYDAYCLGRLYLFGEYIEQDLRLAEKWLLYAATGPSGIGTAAELLGEEYASGVRLKQDGAAAIRWLSVAAAHSRRAQRLLGEIFRSGTIVPKDTAKAIEWLNKAAAQDDLDAMLSLGTMYANGETGSVEQAAAQAWFGQIASICKDKLTLNLPNPSNYAFFLAGLYEKGQSVEENQNKAVALYRQAAALKHAGAIARLLELGFPI